jgi:hypothetical protein
VPRRTPEKRSVMRAKSKSFVYTPHLLGRKRTDRRPNTLANADTDTRARLGRGRHNGPTETTFLSADVREKIGCSPVVSERRLKAVEEAVAADRVVDAPERESLRLLYELLQ